MYKTLADLTVLVIDDSQSARNQLIELLEQHDVRRVMQAADGCSAIAQFERALLPIDLVFCELAMSGMDGATTMRDLAKRGLTAPVVFMSALNPRLIFEAAAIARQTGVRVLATIGKPVDSDAIGGLLIEALSFSRSGLPPKSASVSADDLDSALAEQRIEVHYQPKIRLSDGFVTGVEALARLRHPQRGLLNAGCFIPVAERLGGGRLTKLNLRILRYAIIEAGIWRECGCALDVSINLSVSTMQDPDLPDIVAGYADDAGVPRSSIGFELPESDVFKSASVLDTALRLRHLGFHLSLDNFGLGNTGRHQLDCRSFDQIKVDRRFVDGAAADDGLRSMLLKRIELGRQMHMQVAAEGVETFEDWRLLEEMGCDEIQGFLASRPLPPSQLPSFTRHWNLQRH